MGIELLTTAEMREADRRTIASGTSGYELMLRAGDAVARAAETMTPPGARILIVCGPGNNGGDGFVAARRLAERGFSVEVALLGRREALQGDAALAAADWGGGETPLTELDTGRADLIIDALFGAGLARDVAGDARQVIERINAARKPVLAVDIPSGVDGDSGRIRGAAVRASATITFARAKPGHILMPGRGHAGAVAVADIGIPDDTIRAVASPLFVNEPALWRSCFPVPSAEGHKYSRGHALVLSGGMSRTGAARLAACAALRAGAGLVTLASPRDALAVNAAHLTAVMLRACDGADELRSILTDARFNALALGPALGVGADTCRLVAAALGSGRAAVLDADALTSFSDDPVRLAKLAAGAALPPVLTPHEGEFSRLTARTGVGGADLPKHERARRAAASLCSVIVLKGPDTVIAAPDGRAAINRTGSPYLATAGSGDVLTGLVAGLLAQGMAPFEAACAAVWLHGRVGEHFGPGLIAEDLPQALPGVLRDVLTEIASDRAKPETSARGDRWLAT